MYKNKHYDLYLADLNRRFPGKAILTKTDIFTFDGRSRNTVYKYFPEIKKCSHGISKVKYAMLLAERDFDI